MSAFAKIYDAVHGFIRFNALEKQLIDSPPFQRLHYIHQLGISFLVYPGATHTRFEHSLGTMELATRIFNQITSKMTEVMDPEDIAYWRQIVRLSALCHDLGHLPFSHVAEKRLLGKGGHEAWTLEVIRSACLRPIWDQLQAIYPTHPVIEDLIKTALGPEKCQQLGLIETFSPWQRVMTEILTGDFFGADRIDYLLRDAQCTGVSYGLFDYHQLIEMLCLLPPPYEGHLGVEENGVESCEALLLARHFMHRRVYQYPSSKSYSFHLSRFMGILYAQGNFLNSLDIYLSQTDNEVLVALRGAAADPAHPGHRDACALLHRQRRFLALPVPIGIQEGDLHHYQQQLHMDKEDLDFAAKAVSTGTRDAFFVLKRSGVVVDSVSCASLHIPAGDKRWVFVAPEYASALQAVMERP